MTNENFTTRLLSFITLGMVMHYFLSYMVISKKLSPYNLSLVKILSVEDVLFTMAESNLLLTFGIAALVICIFMPLIGINIQIKDLLFYRMIPNKKKKWKLKIKPIENQINNLLLLIIIAILAVLPSYHKLLLILAIPLTYAMGLGLSKHKQEIRLIAIVFFVYFSVTYQTIKSNPNFYSSNIVLQLKDGSTIISDSTHTLVFYGTRYIVFKDGNTFDTNVYPTSEVKSFKLIKEKEKFLEVVKEIETIEKDSIN